MFRRSEHHFDPRFPMPLRFEQVDEDTFVEPFFGSFPIGSVAPEDCGSLCAQVKAEPIYCTTQWRLLERLLDRYRFTVALDMHQGSVQERVDERTGERIFDDAAQNWMRAAGHPGYNQDQLELGHSLADRIEASWRRLGVEVMPRNLLEKGRVFSAANITDFIHFCGRGNPASWFVEENKGPGTSKKMQKRIHVEAIQEALMFLMERAN